jgi:hypothetical protein
MQEVHSLECVIFFSTGTFFYAMNSGNIKTWTENKIIKDNGTKEMYN